MTDFFCWEDGEGEASGALMERCLDADDAATSYAKRVYDDSAGECGQGFEVHVREDGGAEVKVFKIEVDYDPTFTAWEQAA